MIQMDVDIKEYLQGAEASALPRNPSGVNRRIRADGSPKIREGLVNKSKGVKLRPEPTLEGLKMELEVVMEEERKQCERFQAFYDEYLQLLLEYKVCQAKITKIKPSFTNAADLLANMTKQARLMELETLLTRGNLILP
jgi:hypothetical protein